MRYFLLLFVFFTNILVSAQGVDHWESLVNAGNEWRYFTGVSEPPAAWTDLTFDDGSWAKGPGGIGYGDGDDATIIMPVASVYLRRTFTVTNLNAIASLLLFVDFDDGFVAYLNGKEIARANIGTPGTRPTFNQYANNCDYEAQLPTGGTPARFALTQLQKGYLQAGENVLAVQVHNCNATSSDLSSTTFLIAGLTIPGTFYQAVPGWFSTVQAQSGNLPLVMIETGGRSIPNEPKIDAWMRVIDNGPGIPNSIYDTNYQYDGAVGIEVRGQSSQSFPKKSYGFETRTQAGAENKVGLLGMPAHDDWVLYAPYSDKTMLRNDLSYYLGRRMGRWQPDAHFVEVYLNGQYIGVYQLIERIKRYKDRVDIAKMETSDTSGDRLTGGYIFKVDKTQDLSPNDYFWTNPIYRYQNARNYAYSYYYPKSENIVFTQRNYLKDFIYRFENSLNGHWFTLPSDGYMRYIDPVSFIDFQIVNELANNVDGYRYSTFFHKQRDSQGGKLVAGPLWDFDLGYGNVNYSSRHLATNMWSYMNYGPNEPHCIHWWARMMEDPAYVQQVKIRYSQLRRGVLHTDSINAYLDARVDQLGAAVDRNFQRWRILGTYVWPNNHVGTTHISEVNYMKNWIRNRLIWMDSQWLIPTNAELPVMAAGPVVYPNPATDVVNLHLPGANNGGHMVEVFDIRGSRMAYEMVRFYDGNTVQLQVTHLPSGIYLLRISDGRKQVYSSKITIARR